MNEDERLRAFCAARDAGDEAAMARTWAEVLVDLVPRVEGIVARQGRGKLFDEWEAEEAYGRVLERLAAKVRATFRGTTMGELVNTTKQLAWFVVTDLQREGAERRKREAPAPGWDPEEGEDRSSTWEADEAEWRFLREVEVADAHALVHGALPELEPRRRRVVELTLEGATTPEIQAELGISADNVHQLRSRALKDLAKLMEDRDA